MRTWTVRVTSMVLHSVWLMWCVAGLQTECATNTANGRWTRHLQQFYRRVFSAEECCQRCSEMRKCEKWSYRDKNNICTLYDELAILKDIKGWISSTGETHMSHKIFDTQCTYGTHTTHRQSIHTAHIAHIQHTRSTHSTSTWMTEPPAFWRHVAWTYEKHQSTFYWKLLTITARKQ